MKPVFQWEKNVSLKKKSHNDKNIFVYHNRTDEELHTNTEFKLRTADFVYLANSFL